MIGTRRTGRNDTVQAWPSFRFVLPGGIEVTIRVGIIGASFARAAYLPALRQIPDAKVVAIASARLQSATSTAEEFGVSAAYDDWQEMLRNHELDLVCIATPTDTHGPMTLAALKAGAHVLCEKPMAMDAAEAAQMPELAASLGRIRIRV